MNKFNIFNLYNCEIFYEPYWIIRAMIFLDISNCTPETLKHFPDDTPKRIPLIKGKHFRDYDVHPLVRKERWYLEILVNQMRKHPSKDSFLPIGTDYDNLTGAGAFIDRRGPVGNPEYNLYRAGG